MLVWGGGVGGGGGGGGGGWGGCGGGGGGETIPGVLTLEGPVTTIRRKSDCNSGASQRRKYWPGNESKIICRN